MSAPSHSRDLDIVVYGASGFAGRLVAGYMAEHAPAELAIGLAGRSKGKLEAVRGEIPGAAGWPVLVADSGDEASLQAMAARTRVVLTTVGPYAQYGLPVVAACANAGTHYCDLTGEVSFMRNSIDAFDDIARNSGARIVHSCGFDSIPSDLGVLALHLAAAETGDGALHETVNALVKANGGFSGGTAASGIGEIEAAGRDRDLARIVADPYALSPDRDADPSGENERDLSSMAYSKLLDAWVAPFIMGPLNSRAVRRSNAVMGYPYSREFRYQEVLRAGSGKRGAVVAAGVTTVMGLGYAAVRNGLTRGLVQRFLPDPGDGPNERTRDAGFFVMKSAAIAGDGRRITGKVAADGDPGYKATAMMMSQAGLTLALQQADLPDAAGVLTPASGLGTAAIDRLRAAGMTIEATVAE